MVSTVRSQRILWVEPGLAPGDIATREFSATAPHLRFHSTKDGLAALDLIDAGHAFDLVIAGVRSADKSTGKFVRQVRQRSPELPVVIITDEGDETAAALLRLGCADYVVEGARYLTQLPRTIEHALERTRLEQTVRRLQGELASRDALIEQTISERTALVRQVQEHVTDAFVALDADWRYTCVNASAAQAFNRRAEDLIGKHIWTEFPEGVGQPFHLAYEKAMADQQPVFLEDYYPPFDRWFDNRIYPSQLV